MLNVTRKGVKKVYKNKIKLTKTQLDTICSNDIGDFIIKISLVFLELLKLAAQFLNMEQ